MLYGGSLPTRLYLTDKYENLRFMQSITEATQVDSATILAGTVVAEVAMYWHNPTYDHIATDRRLLDQLHPANGQRGRLIQVSGASQIVLQFPVHPRFRQVTDPGVRILKENGFEVRGAE